MKFAVIDLEYFSLSNAKSSFKNLVKFKKILYPEIFQLGCIQFSTKSKKKIKTNLYFKTYQKIPKRLIKLTKITHEFLNNNGDIFSKRIKKIIPILKKKNIFLSNGDDLKIIKMNYKRFIKKKIGINVKFINLRKILGDTDTEFYFKKNEKSKRAHNAIEDCEILIKVFKKYLKNKDIKEIKKIIEKNIEFIEF